LEDEKIQARLIVWARFLIDISGNITYNMNGDVYKKVCIHKRLSKMQE